MTKKPLNINDNEIFDGMSRDERTLSEPTAMSYGLQRIKLAEICRSMIDRAILSMSNSGEPSHNDIMDCDTELQLLENDIQPFWNMSEAQLIEKYNMTPDHADQIRNQGRSVYFFIYTTRLKWHLPYFTRALTNPTYSASREICLNYASKIIKLQTHIEHTRFRTATRYYFTYLILGVFMASMVLLMDLCPKRASPDYEKRREEVAEAFRLLENSKDESEMAAQFVSTLMTILRKHRLPPPKPSNRTTPQATSPVAVEHYQPTPMTSNIATPESFLGQCNNVGVLGIPSSSAIMDTGSSMDFSMDETVGGNLVSYLGEFTQSFKNGGEVESFDWNDFFSELNFPSFI
jgi:hypothetical protein